MKKEGKNDKFNSIILLSLIGFFLLINFTFTSANSNVLDLTSFVKDYFIEVIKGNVAGTTSINKFGENLVVGNTEEDIQSQGGTLTFLTSPEKINITSSSGSDTIAGTGGRKVIIEGLDENFTEISEEVNLSGATVSQTSNSYIRVYRMYLAEVGTYGGTNVGTITGTAEVNATTQIEIAIGNGQSQTTHYTVPSGKRAIIKHISITMDTGKVINTKMIVRPLANNTASSFAPHKHLEHWHGLDAPILVESFANKLIDEKTDIWFIGITSVGNSEVEVNYDLILYDK